jgi:hypothetical protein
MARDGDAMKKKQPKKTWAPRRPLPKLATSAEEERLWLSHDFDDVMEAGGEGVVYELRATRRHRTHVYRVRLDHDQEMSKLQALARRPGVTVSVVLRDLARAARAVRSGASARE